ncbi:MAG: CRTAC1 family protein [Acidobacteria bacterium]|nr:CRTAC1 family protein [Acidobacteriota bacterium]
MATRKLSPLLAIFFCATLVVLAGSLSSPERAAKAFPVQFVDITRPAGIRFQHNNGAFGQKYLPETMGAGCAFLDYNNDSWQDILLVNGMDWPGHKRRTSYPALYRNNKNGTFTDVTREAGLAVEIYGMGTAIGDCDNDGWVDIFISALGPDRLFKNLGNGKFVDVTQKAGLSNPDYGASAAWLDYDRDGDLDLVVTNYVQWSVETDIRCSLDGVNKSYCTPESYKGVSSRLYQNQGKGTFADVTQKAGLLDPTGKALGVAVFDSNNDGWPDLLVANDTQPNRLYMNNKNGTFAERGVQAGIAFSEDGTVRGAMGVDAADYDGSGFASLLIANFSNEMLNLYHNEGKGLFVDEAPTSTVGQASLLTLAFGCFFFDLDLDGRMDIFVANGHVENDINKVQKRVTYPQPPHLFHNRGNKQFAEITQQVGASLKIARVARGAAYGDIDNDGDLDVLVTTNGGPAILWRNDGGNVNQYLKIKPIGTRSNRDGIGAQVRLKLPSGTLWQQVKSGSSYCSQSELPLTFGLGRTTAAPSLEVVWPSGAVDRISNVSANQFLTIQEGTNRAEAWSAAKTK